MLYVVDPGNRALCFQGDLGVRPGREVLPQAETLSDRLAINVSEGRTWLIQGLPDPAQADERRDGEMGNDCRLGVLYEQMHYTQHGAFPSQN